MITIPSKLNARLIEEHRIIILDSLIPFSHLLQENKLYFFPEYTDHGINHIEGVLRSIENLISDDTFDKLSSLDICAIIIATVLHDIGMHTSPEMFRNMLTGEYDDIPDNLFKEKTWKELWDEFLKDSRFWNEEKKEKIFGGKDYNIKEPNLVNLSENDIKFIGEFIRLHHARLAYEIALNGYKGDKTSIVFNFEKNQQLHNKKFLQISGLIARSHGMNVRETFAYLKPYGETLWKKPLEIKVVFIMTLIRLADYIQIDSSRTNELKLKLRKFSSPFSLKEHETHLAIDHIHLVNDDKELIYVEASPKDAMMYVKIDSLIQDIQKEFDLSWAILGEVYGDQYKLRYRRIESNLTDENVKKGYGFVPKEFGFRFNSELTKLLIAPLYGDDPSYGVRELVQNAVDACRTRMVLDEEYKKLDIVHVEVSLNFKSEQFTIKDTGIGMTIEEIEKYFLTIGSSYDNNVDWQKARELKDDTNDINRIYRTGRFGIGILAAFLIGQKITVKTKRFNTDQGYTFTMSLDKSFIQINREPDLDYGTTIEINSLNKTIMRLEGNTHSNNDMIWYDWYIFDKPKVMYYQDGEKMIPSSTNVINEYKKLEHTSYNYGDIYWKPEMFFTRTTINKEQFFTPDLYCNGFFITKCSNKSVFSMFHDIENYMPLGLPSLIISDIYNSLPLNLQRNNINKEAIYPFEKELAEAMYKDALCQLLAISIKDYKHTHNLFFGKSGFTINSGIFYEKLVRHDATLLSSDAKVKCLLGKTLVHIFGKSKNSNYLNHKSVMQILEHFEDVFITLYDRPRTRVASTTYSTNLRILLQILTKKRSIRDISSVLAVHSKKIQHFKKSTLIYSHLNYAKTRSFISSEDYNDDTLFIIDSNNTGHKELAKEIIDQFNNEPLFFFIYKIKIET